MNETRDRSMPAPPAGGRGPLLLALIALLVALSVWSLDLQIAAFAEPDALGKMREFLAGFVPPETAPVFLGRLGVATLETLAMSALGTLIAMLAAIVLAWPASRRPTGPGAIAMRSASRLVLNALRSQPELVWASLFVIAAGLGPFPGTMALAAHTTGVLGRLFADTLENLPEGPARALRANGASTAGVFLYATLPQALLQLMAYSLYRWENNIRAAAVLGVVGAGGLGQMLYVSLSLFQMRAAATVVLAMVAVVTLVDLGSYLGRRALSR